MGLFKITTIEGNLAGVIPPFPTKFVSALGGSDTNLGTRTSPKATIVSAGGHIALSGIVQQNAFVDLWIIGENQESGITGDFRNGGNYGGGGYGIKIGGNATLGNGGFNFIKCHIKGTLFGEYSNRDYTVAECFIMTDKLSFGADDLLSRNRNNTIFYFKNNQSNSVRFRDNSIYIMSVDLYNYYSRNVPSYYPIFRYCLFRKATIWEWNGATIPINYGTYGNTEGDYMADVISGLYAYANAMSAGTDKTYFLAMIPSANSSNIFYVDANGPTCKVVEDRPSIVGSKKIFNRYVGDNPVDYSLYLSSDNVALNMSNDLSYVGCYKANAKVLTFGEVIHVNSDGSDDLVTVPDMLISDGNGKFHVSTADSVQVRNRVRSDVFNFKRGFNLTAFQSQMKSGLGSRFSMGKFQPYNITDAPTLPQESIEILPYDDLNTPSLFPRFSGMFNGQCQMWYHTTGAKINQPVLFNDLQSFFAITTDKSLAEYGTWAVTNADFETYLLSSKTGVALRNIPVYYGRIELNLNYHI